MKSKFFALIMLITCIFLLVSCDEPLTVTFSANGGTFNDGETEIKVEIDEGELIAMPKEPTREGYTFSGWSKKDDAVDLWNFDSDKVTKNITFYAVWSKESHIHSFANYVSDNNATCISDGTMTAKCDDCDETDTKPDLDSRLQHVIITHEAKEATCTEKGYKAYNTCANCDYTTYESIEAQGHYYIWDYNDTEHWQKCSKCNEKKSVVIHTLNLAGRCDCGYGCQHEVGIAATCTSQAVCSKCENPFGKFAEHTPTEIPEKAPTCTETGLTLGSKCSVCDEILKAQILILAKRHSWDDGEVSTEPTCTEKGVKTFECDNCDATKTEDVNANGHNYSSVVTNKTCAANGRITFTCPTCDDTYEEIIAPISISIAHIGTSSSTMNGYGRFSLSYKITTSDGYGIVLCKMELFKTSSANSVSQMDYTDFSDSNYQVSYTGYEDTINEYYLVITTKDDANNITICKVDLGSTVITEQYVKDDHNYSDIDDKCILCGKLIDYTEGLRYELINNETEYAVSSIGNATDVDIIIPRTYNGKLVTAIGESAFQGDKTIKSIRLHSEITSIGDDAFMCSSLSLINFPNSLKTIGRTAFSSTEIIGELTLPNSVTSIGSSAFCLNEFNSFKLSSSINTLSYNIFGCCTNLTSLTLSKSVQHIKDAALSGCENLTDIVFEGTKAEWSTITKEAGWDAGTGNYIIHCTDGDLTKAEA